MNGQEKDLLARVIGHIDTSRYARQVGDIGSAESALEASRRVLLNLAGISADAEAEYPASGAVQVTAVLPAPDKPSFSGQPLDDSIHGSIHARRLPGGNIELDTTHTVGGLFRSRGDHPHIEIEQADLMDVIAALHDLAGLVLPRGCS